MTRNIPESDSAAAVDRNHLLAVFDPSADDPISQRVRDVVPLSAYLRAADSPDDALRIRYGPADESWVFETRAGNVGTAATLRIPGATNPSSNYLLVSLPDVFRLHGTQHDFTLAKALRATNTAAAVAASTNIPVNHGLNSGFTVTHNTAGLGGNDFVVEVSYRQTGGASATYTSDDHMVVTMSYFNSLQNVIDAINAARRNNVQIVTATHWGSFALGDAVEAIRTGDHQLSGGLEARTSSSEPLSFAYPGRAGDTEEFLLTVSATDTLSSVKDAMTALSFAGGQPFFNNVLLVGDGSVAVGGLPLAEDTWVTTDFAGGTDPQLNLGVDPSSKVITLRYTEGYHHLRDVILDFGNGVSITAVPGAHREQLLPAPGDVIAFGFDESFRESDILMPYQRYVGWGDGAHELPAEIELIPWSSSSAGLGYDEGLNRVQLSANGSQTGALVYHDERRIVDQMDCSLLVSVGYDTGGQWGFQILLGARDPEHWGSNLYASYTSGIVLYKNQDEQIIVMNTGYDQIATSGFTRLCIPEEAGSWEILDSTRVRNVTEAERSNARQRNAIVKLQSAFQGTDLVPADQRTYEVECFGNRFDLLIDGVRACRWNWAEGYHPFGPGRPINHFYGIVGQGGSAVSDVSASVHVYGMGLTRARPEAPVPARY